MGVKKIYNFTNIAPHYRALLWTKLLNSANFDFHFFYGKNKSIQIKEIDFSGESFQNKKGQLNRLKNVWVKGKVLIWQFGVVEKCLFDKPNAAIFLGEFQVLSTWIAMIICKIKGIKVVYWTHGLYGNESQWKRKLRVLFYKTADKLLLYERRGEKLLIAQGIDSCNMSVIFNSLDYDTHRDLREKKEITQDQKLTFFNNNELPYLIFVGRLTKNKKLDLLINSLQKVNHKRNKVNLLFVGDGDQKTFLSTLVKENKLEEYVYFFGSCYDEAQLASYIYHADLCVSPGNVGLTAIHSLSFGTPVCTHKNYFNQMPEVDAVKEGVTGCFFEENNIASLTEQIENWLSYNSDRENIRKKCYQIIDTHYNPYYQVNVISELIG